MPSWTEHDEEQYEAVRDSLLEDGKSEKRAKEIAARIVNKRRRKEGRTPNTRTQGTGNPNKPYEVRTKDELYNRAKQLNIKGRSKMNKQQLIEALRARG